MLLPIISKFITLPPLKLSLYCFTKLFDPRHPNSSALNEAIIIFLSGFPIEFMYFTIPSKNEVPDALSRAPSYTFPARSVPK